MKLIIEKEVFINRVDEFKFNKAAADNLGLSDREIEVLQLIAEGLTNLEMADKLFISKRTVEGHRQSLLDKTGSRNTAKLIRYAATHGLLK